MAANVILLDGDVPAMERMTYLVLSSYAWQSEECWPGQAAVAKILGCGERSLRDYINNLEARGWVTKVRRGLGLTNVYHLHLPSRPANIADPEPVEPADKEDSVEEGTYLSPSSSTGLELRSTGTPARARAETLGEKSARDLCLRLADRIEANGCRRPVVTQAWLKEARLLVDKDGVSTKEVLYAIDWATSHHFWKANILSMPKLRLQFDRLRLQSQAEQTAPSPTRAYDAAMESLREMAESS